MAKFKIGEKVRYEDKIVTISTIEEYTIDKIPQIILDFSENSEPIMYMQSCFSKLISCPEYMKNETQI